uniref:Ras-related GTP-binding protein n=1 Tax=Parascaris equorum TaxID=6256 RepID=A0A914RIF0_PAREQ
LIYVFDVESRELEKDYRYYQSCLEALLQNSPNAKVFCLIHKMDLVSEEHRDQAWSAIVYQLVPNVSSMEMKLKQFAIILDADERLPLEKGDDVSRLEVVCIFVVSLSDRSMNRFFKVMLFEKATFLVIAQAQITQHRDVHRFEKVSNIIKQFKLSCR